MLNATPEPCGTCTCLTKHTLSNNNLCRFLGFSSFRPGIFETQVMPKPGKTRMNDVSMVLTYDNLLRVQRHCNFTTLNDVVTGESDPSGQSLADDQ